MIKKSFIPNSINAKFQDAYEYWRAKQMADRNSVVRVIYAPPRIARKNSLFDRKNNVSVYLALG